MAAGLAWASPSQAQDLVGTYWQDLVGQRGLDPEWHPQRLGKMMAWATAESLFVQPIDMVCPLALCSQCGAGGSKPQGFKLPFVASGGKPLPFAIVKSEGGSEYKPEPGNVTVIFAHTNGTLWKTTAAWDANGVPAPVWKTGNLALGTGGAPALVLPAADFDGSKDSAALVLGTKGLGLRLTWDANGPKTTDLGLPVDDYSARGGRYLGTAHGGIYRFTEFPALEKVAQPQHTSIRALDSVGALGTGGDFLFVRNGKWFAANSRTSVSARAWKIRWTQNGLAARVWAGGSQAPSDFKLPEAQTAIRSTTPAEWKGHANAAPIFFNGGPPVDFKIVAEDQDGGFAAPVIRRIRGKDTTVLLQGFTAGIPGFGFNQASRPTDGCAGNGSCLRGDAPAIDGRLTADSIVMTVPAITGHLNLMCPNIPYSERVRDTVVRVAADFRQGDRVELILGKDSLDIVRDIPNGLVARAAWWLYDAGAELRSGFDAAGRKLASRAGASGVKGRAIPTPRFTR